MVTKNKAAPAAKPAKPNRAAKKTNVEFEHVMIDLETLDTTSRAAIISIGAVRFNADDFSPETFYRVIKVQSNIDAKRTISGSTLAWWMDQGSEAKNVFKDPAAVSLDQALYDLRAFIGPHLVAKNTKVWGNGAIFDLGILNDAYTQMRESPPWEYWNIKCFRMIKDSTIGRSVLKPANAVAHNALSDALHQAEHLQMIWAAGYPQ